MRLQTTEHAKYYCIWWAGEGIVVCKFQEERPVALLPVIILHTTIFCGMLKVC
jgi:hypothetical protein